MLHLVISFLFIVVFNELRVVVAWNPSNFTFNPGDDYQLVWQDKFENVGPVQAIINGQPAYSPNPKNWYHLVGKGEGLEYFTNSIYNSYVQNNQLTIVAMKENYTSAMLSSENLQEFTFGVFVAKIRMPFGKGMWPAWWMRGHDHHYNLKWPTTGEIDMVEMWGGTKVPHFTNQYVHGTIHWNNQSNTMNPLYNKQITTPWGTPDGSMLHNNSLVYWSKWTPTDISIGVNEFIFSVINTTYLPESINPVWAFSGKWPFNMYLDLAIIDKSPGPPDDTNVWPQEMVVDWVRVYQKKEFI